MENISLLTKETFRDYINKSNLIMVDFYAEWCQPCQRFLKIYPNLANQLSDKMQFAKVDVDKEFVISDEMGIDRVPTFIIFQNGIEVERWEGIKPLLDMKRKLDGYINSLNEEGGEKDVFAAD